LNIILDACAVIAFFRNEVGAAGVEQYLLNPDRFCLIHAVNLCEVYYDFLKSCGAQEADRMT
jgi:PIN domain nuclease of toxin-antitoxin system